MSHDRPTISTHVLDTADGRPRAGMRVRLRGPADDGPGPIIGEAVTDADGRIPDLVGGAPLGTGVYQLEFVLDPDGFFTRVAVDLRVDDATRSYHVPLLLAPFGITTYRGS